MTRSLFVRLPVVSGNSALPVIPESDIDYLVEHEPSSYDHWIFDKGNSGGLVGRKSGKLLTPQSEGYPVFGSSYLTLKNVFGYALLTDCEDSAAPTDTMCAVIRSANLNASQVLFGCMGTAGENTGGGAYLSNVVDPNRFLTVTYRPSAFSTISMEQTAASGAWLFVAVSRDLSGSTKRVIGLIGGQAPVVKTSTANYTRAPSPRTLALGNAYFNNASTGSADSPNFAEFMLFPRALTAADLQAVYARSKARMAKRSIAVV